MYHGINPEERGEEGEGGESVAERKKRTAAGEKKTTAST